MDSAKTIERYEHLVTHAAATGCSIDLIAQLLLLCPFVNLMLVIETAIDHEHLETAAHFLLHHCPHVSSDLFHKALKLPEIFWNAIKQCPPSVARHDNQFTYCCRHPSSPDLACATCLARDDWTGCITLAIATKHHEALQYLLSQKPCCKFLQSNQVCLSVQVDDPVGFEIVAQACVVLAKRIYRLEEIAQNADFVEIALKYPALFVDKMQFAIAQKIVESSCGMMIKYAAFGLVE
jgi:hypothetical protein